MGRGKNRRRIDAAQRAAELGKTLVSRAGILLRAFGLLSLAVALVWGGYSAWTWALTSDVFAVQSVSFHGLRRATEEDLVRVSGLTVGRNLLALNASVAAAAMRQNPWVKRADVSRRLPSSVFVVVTEREPVAMAALGDLYLLDGEGQPFKRVQPQDAVDVPLVSGVSRDEYMASPEGASLRFRHALEVLDAYGRSERPAGAKVSEVRLEAEGLVLVSGQGLEIHLSDSAPDEQLGRLGKALAELTRRGLTAEVIRLDNRVRPSWVTASISTPTSERKGAK